MLVQFIQFIEARPLSNLTESEGSGAGNPKLNPNSVDADPSLLRSMTLSSPVLL
jgi:hypothetical protein